MKNQTLTNEEKYLNEQKTFDKFSFRQFLGYSVIDFIESKLHTYAIEVNWYLVNCSARENRRINDFSVKNQREYDAIFILRSIFKASENWAESLVMALGIRYAIIKDGEYYFYAASMRGYMKVFESVESVRIGGGSEFSFQFGYRYNSQTGEYQHYTDFIKARVSRDDAPDKIAGW